ncbi:hypothetical protein [Bosea sp. Root381]|uniref:hypothetical protein n=1 Tax=Bosea sp. Root381 TaxID=1736524 RepID=UPI000AB11CFD|nr:hypothetical protein [Bosea sp. Root381]
MTLEGFTAGFITALAMWGLLRAALWMARSHKSDATSPEDQFLNPTVERRYRRAGE